MYGFDAIYNVLTQRNELYLKHNEVSFNTTTNGAVAYEGSIEQSPEKECFRT